MSWRICTVQILPWKYVRQHADFTTPTRQHELASSYRSGNRSAEKDLDNAVGIDDLSVRGAFKDTNEIRCTARSAVQTCMQHKTYPPVLRCHFIWGEAFGPPASERREYVRSSHGDREVFVGEGMTLTRPLLSTTL